MKKSKNFNGKKGAGKFMKDERFINNEISKTDDKILSYSIEKLNDENVVDIVGGLSIRAKCALTVSGGVAAFGTVAGVLPLAACSGLCLYKAKKAQEAGRVYEAKLMWRNYCSLVWGEGVLSFGVAVFSTMAGLAIY